MPLARTYKRGPGTTILTGISSVNAAVVVMELQGGIAQLHHCSAPPILLPLLPLICPSHRNETDQVDVWRTNQANAEGPFGNEGKGGKKKPHTIKVVLRSLMSWNIWLE